MIERTVSSLGRWVDITGRRYGRLVVLSYSHAIGYTHYYLCQCDCGKQTTVAKNALTTGKQVSCGCYRSEVIKNINKLPDNYLQLGKIFRGMKARCYNPRSVRYKRYGGRGIKICEEWLQDINTFRSWAVENGYKPGLSIDRINNDGDYSPDNCRWVQPKDQLSNCSINVFVEFNGKCQTLAQWSRELNIPTSTLHNRIRVHGWPIERALTEPVRSRKT